MKSPTGLLIVASCVNMNAARRVEFGQEILSASAQPANRADLPPCPCTIWRHCQPKDVLPPDGGGEDGRGDGKGVACVASEDAIISMGHQVQCVPPRHGGVNYYCPPILPIKCDPGAECLNTHLASCMESDCQRPAWLPKERTPAFCAMEDCTHAECCDEGAVAVTEAPEAGGHENDSCAELVKALAETTLARIMAYERECHFNAGDVNFGGDVDFSNGQFDLTKGGKKKLWAEHCQRVKVLRDSPDDVFADAQALQVKCPDHARLRAQMSAVGIFATAQVLDHFWKACKDSGFATCAPPTTTPKPTPEPVTAAPKASCEGTFTFNVELSSSSGQKYKQSLTVHSASHGKMEHLQCDSGPMQYGSFNMMCQDGNWVMTNHGNPCYDNEVEANAAAERDRAAGGFVPIKTVTLVDLTAIVNRLQENKDSTVMCCCSEESRCSVHENIRRCKAANPETPHSHDRTEGGRCIVNEEEKGDYERILQMNVVKPRFATPDVPTVSSQEAEDYRDCVDANSVGQCERCTHNVQCQGEMYCCPFLKLCVETVTTECPSDMMASCNGCFERFTPNPEQCDAHCENPAFPKTWLPACSSGSSGSWWQRFR